MKSKSRKIRINFFLMYLVHEKKTCSAFIFLLISFFIFYLFKNRYLKWNVQLAKFSASEWEQKKIKERPEIDKLKLNMCIYFDINAAVVWVNPFFENLMEFGWLWSGCGAFLYLWSSFRSSKFKSDDFSIIRRKGGLKLCQVFISRVRSLWISKKNVFKMQKNKNLIKRFWRKCLKLAILFKFQLKVLKLWNLKKI